MAVIETHGEKETAEYAASFAGELKSGAFVALRGGLGAGKTAFTRGIAQGLGVKEPVVSPTFTLLRVYESGRLPLYHFDVYRIGDAEELAEIGFSEYADAQGVCVCEWADLIEEELPEERIDIVIERVDDDTRKIVVTKR